MTPETFWLGRLTAFSIAFSLLAYGFQLFGAPESSGRVQLRSYVAGLNVKLHFLRSRVRGEQLVIAQVVAGLACLAGAGAFGQWPLLFVLPVLAFAPKILIEQGAARRVTKIEEQIEPWLNAVANALKASPSLGEAIESTTSLLQAPISEELDILIKEHKFGTPIEKSLQNLAERIGSRLLSGAVLALKVASKTGGNLPQTLENAAAALRELARLEGVVRTKTAEGKAQTLVIGAIPIPMVAGIHAMDPDFFDPLSRTFTGNLVIGSAVVLWAIAILAARKILAVDV